ncbi:MAG: HAD hydrolase-like protein [Chromatiales bacterium]|jgi:phosphoglycolate phosphatase
MTYSSDRLIILDADGTSIDAFNAIASTFAEHGMDIGDLSRFQKRHNLFKYLGGVKEFPKNLKKQLSTRNRQKLIATLTEVYREQACLYPDMREFIAELVAEPGVKVGVVTRNITNEPIDTLRVLFQREGVDIDALDFLVHIPLKESKAAVFRDLRKQYCINPALSYMCGDEYKDYKAALAAGIHPFMVSYGFEDFERLTQKFEVPEDIICRASTELTDRVRHALGLPMIHGVAESSSSMVDIGCDTAVPAS